MDCLATDPLDLADYRIDGKPDLDPLPKRSCLFGFQIFMFGAFVAYSAAFLYLADW